MAPKAKQTDGDKKAPRSDERGAIVVYIYALKHPVSGEIRYIGKANDIGKRFKTHMSTAATGRTPVYLWIRKLVKQGLVPRMEVVETCTSENWPEVEIAAIAKYKQTHRLLNVAKGGNQPYISNGPRVGDSRNARAVHDNPKSRRVWELKRAMGDNLKYLKANGLTETYNSVVRKLKIAATKNQKLFGAYLLLEEI